MSNEKICGIYKIRNIKNNKIYIGSSYNILNRWKQHKYQLNKNIHNNEHLQRAWNKYGKRNFEFIIIEVIEIIDIYKNMKDYIFEREQYWIDKTNCCNELIGYNIARKAGSKLGVKDSIKTKNKKSLAMLKPERRLIASKTMIKTNNKRYKQLGKDMCINYTTLSNKDIIDINNLILKGFSDLDISQRYKVNKYTINDIRRGKTWSHITGIQYNKRNTKVSKDIALKIFNLLQNGESIKAICDIFNVNNDVVYNIKNGVTFKDITGVLYQKKDNSKKYYNRRNIIQFDKNMNIIKIWNGICEIEKELHFDGSCISKCCRNKRKHYKNFIWKYKTDCELDVVL
jgi:group I intron endonuclease